MLLTIVEDCFTLCARLELHDPTAATQRFQIFLFGHTLKELEILDEIMLNLVQLGFRTFLGRLFKKCHEFLMMHEF